MSKHKRKILCGDWNLENKFAFGSEDRQITVCLLDGKMVDQVKIKASPQSITVCFVMSYCTCLTNSNSFVSDNSLEENMMLMILSYRSIWVERPSYYTI
jgi:hypothetical protein